GLESAACGLELHPLSFRVFMGHRACPALCLMAQFRERRLLPRHKIPYDDSHRSIAQHPSRTVLVGRSYRKHVSSSQRIASRLRVFGVEKLYRHADELARLAGFRHQLRQRVLASRVLKDEFLCVIMHMSADSEQYAVKLDPYRANFRARP